MDTSHRLHLETRHKRSEWHGRAAPNRHMIVGLGFNGSEIPTWTLFRARRDERHTPPEIKTLWHRGEPEVELLSISVWECASIVAAHDQLLEVLANIESGVVERREEDEGVGDVAFALAHTMILFARMNVVVLIRNAGPTLVDVGPVARELDELFLRLSATDQ
jgi:hypothetical protein